jgi:sulfoxide reductase heme-binding subunit YedZ
MAAVAHYYWLVKSDIRLPMLYGTLVALLLAWRVVSRAVRNGTPRRA